MPDHEDETINEENAPPKVVPQITTVTNISTKFPYLKKGDAKSMTTDNDGNLKICPPITIEKHQQNAIKARFGGNDGSKKMQKSLLKQKFEEFKISEEEGLDKGYDKMQKILSQMNTLKIKPETEDVNMKLLRGLPPFWSGYSSSPSTLSNAAFECQAQGGQNSNNYKKYKSKEAGKDRSDSKAMVVVDGSIDWDKQTEEGNTEPRSLENFGMVAGLEIASDADSEGEVVSAHYAIPAGVSVFAGDVATAVVSPHSETEFALMGLSTEPNPVSAGKATLACNSIPLSVSAGPLGRPKSEM
nr:ribonuclease H-like domain-containing protein [Tanacetum cinerariifolium]